MTSIQCVAAVLVLVPAAPSLILAASLAGQLDSILRRQAFQPVDVEVPLLERTVVRGADFPVSSTSADFVYRLDPELGVPERVPKGFGPVFLDTADTVGRNALEFGGYFLYSDFTERDGADLPGTEPRFSFFASPPQIGRAHV